MDDVSITKFIEEAELAGPRGIGGEAEPLPQLTGMGKESAVVDSSLYSFSEKLPPARHQGVANWLLFAQLAATAAVTDRDDSEGWCDAYRTVLERTGWVRTGVDEGWQKESAAGAFVHEKILPIVAAILGPATAAAALVTLALNSLNDMDKSSPWITLFDRRAKSVKQVGFQIGFADVHRDGGVALTGAEYRVEASQTLTQVLWFKFTSNDGGLHYRRLSRWLSEEKYNKHAEAIAARVDAHIAQSIASIPLEPGKA